jgi:hypothetical protein
MSIAFCSPPPSQLASAAAPRVPIFVLCLVAAGLGAISPHFS